LETLTYATPTLGVCIHPSTFHIHLEKDLLLHWEKTPKNIHYVLFYLSYKAPIISVDSLYYYQCIKRDGRSPKMRKEKKEDKSPNAKEKKDSQVLIFRLGRYVIPKEQL